jgi:hypothetical protein
MLFSLNLLVMKYLLFMKLNLRFYPLRQTCYLPTPLNQGNSGIVVNSNQTHLVDRTAIVQFLLECSGKVDLDGDRGCAGSALHVALELTVSVFELHFHFT